MKLLNKPWNGSKWPPRDWQAQALPVALGAIQEQLAADEAPRPIIRAMMGAGKSVLIAEVCRELKPERDEVTVITAPTQKLVRQLSATLRERVGEFSVGQFYARRKEADRPIVVCCMDSAQKLAEALEGYGIGVALLIADECHRTESDSFLEAIEALAPSAQLGFTATPWRAEDKSGLSLFDTLIHNYGPREAIRDGVVVPWRIVPWQGADVKIDEACLEMCRDAFERELGPGVVNAISVDDAEEFAETLRAEGMPAQAIHYKISDSDQERLLGQLERGDLHALVHVSLLQEGVDMPWLMWGCLRRRVQSTVRFPQEVGRFLRAHPGKEFATLYDPHDLFGSMKLDYEAVLAGDITEDDRPPIELALEEIEQQQTLIADPMAIEGRPELMDSIGAYVRQLVVAFDTAGIIEQRVGSGGWRKHPPSDGQLKMIWKMKWVLNRAFISEIPWRHRVAMGWAVEHREFLNKGQASDLLNVLTGMKETRRWPQLAETMATAPANH